MLDFDLLKKAAYVLGSDSHFAKTLAANITACYNGLKVDYQMAALESAEPALKAELDHLTTETKELKRLAKAQRKPDKKRQARTPQSQFSNVIFFPLRDEI